MIAFLVLNWRWLLPSAAAAALGLWFGVVKLELADLRASVATERLEAANLKARVAVENAAKDARNSELALNLDAEHAKHIAEMDSTRAAFEQHLADRLRHAGTGCRNVVSPGPAAPGHAADATAGGDAGRGGVDPVAVSRVRDVTLMLQDEVKTCWAWAAVVGRR